MEENTSNQSAPANTGKVKKNKSNAQAKVSVAGKEYPVLHGAIKMDRIDADGISLSDFPKGSLIEFPDEGKGKHVQALQKVTKDGAEVVLVVRSSEDNQILLNHGVYFGLAAELIEYRQKEQKDIQFLTQYGCLVVAIVPAKGSTVGDTIIAAREVLNAALRELYLIEDGIARKIQKMAKKGMLSKMSDAMDEA